MAAFDDRRIPHGEHTIAPPSKDTASWQVGTASAAHPRERCFAASGERYGRAVPSGAYWLQHNQILIDGDAKSASLISDGFQLARRCSQARDTVPFAQAR